MIIFLNVKMLKYCNILNKTIRIKACLLIRIAIWIIRIMKTI